MSSEIASQPITWASALEQYAQLSQALPSSGARVAAIGCGTSWNVLRSYAQLREAGGGGLTDAFAASEMPRSREYDTILALSRSGTTTEVLEALERCGNKTRTVAVTANPHSPIVDLANESIVLNFADEKSVVQTRFATTALTLLRRHLGDNIDALLSDGAKAVSWPIAPPMPILNAKHVTFLGQGWAYGLAKEAALKLREAAGAWAESYPSMEYRHGPISIASSDTFVWFMEASDAFLLDDVRRTGAEIRESELDPQAELVYAQRIALAMAEERGLDPDQPRHLARSVILSAD